MEEDDVLGASGSVLVSADLSVSEEADALSGAAKVLVSADLSVAEDGDSLSGVVSIPIYATLSVVESNDRPSIRKRFLHRLYIGKTQTKRFTYTFSVGKSQQKRFLHRVNFSSAIQVRFQHNFAVYPYADPIAEPELAYLSSVYGIPPIELATKKNLGPLDVKFLVSGSDIGCIPYQFTINMSESQPTTWALSIMDPFGNNSPLRNNLMDEKPGSLPGPYYVPPTPPGGIPVPAPTWPTPVKTLTVNVKWGGLAWSFSGIPQSWSHTRNWENRYFSFCWKGTDHSVKLNRDNQTMRTVRRQSALSVMKEILNNYGVQYNLSNWNSSEDFVIPVMHRQSGNPMEWLTQILGVRMMEWRMEYGRVFTPYYPPSGASSPSFTHDFEKMEMLEESYEASAQAVINKVVVLRAVESSGFQAFADVFEFKAGYTVSFPTPISMGYYNVVYANEGIFCNFHWMRNGEIIASREVLSGLAPDGGGYTYGGAGSIIDCDSVEFEWHIAPRQGVITGSPGRIEFHGIQKVDDNSWGEPQILGGGSINDPAPWTRAISQNINSQHKYGIRQIELQANPLIPTSAVAQVYADRYIFRVSQQARFATYRLPLNLYIVPGCIIYEIDDMLGLSRRRIVTSATHNLSNDPGNRYTSFTGVDYSPA